MKLPFKEEDTKLALPYHLLIEVENGKLVDIDLLEHLEKE
jgi:hypothetical protein